MQTSDLTYAHSSGNKRLILVIDFEMTCDEGDRMPINEMEIIEIGAVWAAVDGHVLAEFQTLARPKLHPQLTSYCRQLIGITQTDIDAAPMLHIAMDRLAQFAEIHTTEDALWGSWGQSDAQQLAHDCARHGTRNPLEKFAHVNLKREFAKRRRGMKQVGMKKALALVGLPLQGTHHRGLDDARNIAKLLPWTLRTQIQ